MIALAALAIFAWPTQSPASIAEGLNEAVRAALEGRSLDIHQCVAPGSSALEFEARNAAQRLVASFDSEGLRVTRCGEHDAQERGFDLHVTAWGRPTALERAAPAKLSARGAWICLERDGLSEWFHNQHSGLEHGFTIAAPPAEQPRGALEIVMRVGGELTPNVRGADTVEWRDECSRVLWTYSGLRVWDANGRVLPSRLAAVDREFTIRFDDSGATYPVTVDPTIAALEATLLGGPENTPIRLGTRVDIDGDTAVVAAWKEGGSQGPQLSVFVFDGVDWTRQARINTAGLLDSLGGLAVFGDRIVFGRNHDSGSSTPEVRVLERTGATWSYVTGFASINCCTTLGTSVALTADRYAYVNDEGGTKNTRVHRRTATNWMLEKQLPPGGSVAMRDDLLVMQTNPAPSWSNPEIRVYQRTGTDWTLIATPLLPPSGVYPVALDEEHSIAVGAPNDSSAGANAGAVHVFRRDGNQWLPWAKIDSPLPPQTNSFGAVMAFESGTLAVGAPRDDLVGLDAGAVYVYRRNGGWTLTQVLTAPGAAPHDRFGESVAIEGARVLVGAPGDDNFSSEAGSAYVFRMSYDAEVYCTAKLNSLGCLPEIAFAGAPSASSPAPFVVSALRVRNQSNGLFFYGVGGRATDPFQGALRCVATPIVRTMTINSAGNADVADCSGRLALDFNAWVRSGVDPNLVTGVQVNGQFWYRDTAAAFGTGLSDAIEFVIAN